MQKLEVPNKRITITLTPDTEKRLREYANTNHMTVSQSVTYMVWNLLQVSDKPNV